ncbi:MAG TPA: penicillin-insensitive murein endopeptidase [Bryobacteraceae bacterium]|nr:penicillin-insensitive murein endopeptidase [Bryobacteraceae bacterium]
MIGRARRSPTRRRPVRPARHPGRATARSRRKLPKSIVKRNQHWAKKLRWKRQFPKVARTIGAAPGITTADAFVEALKRWQAMQGLQPNGVLGPQTWDAMKPAMEPGPSAAPTAEPPAAEPPDTASPDAADEPSAAGEPHPPECQCPECPPEAADADDAQGEVWDWLKGWTSKATSVLPSWSSTPSTSVDRTANVYIRWVQGGLNRILGLNLTVDGVLGPMTKAAIRDFQTKQSLTADGAVGAATEQALIRAGAGNPPATPIPSTTGVNTLLPASGPGFYSKPESWPYRQYGIPETISAIQAIGRAWQARYPKGPRFGITDISKKGGGPFEPHKSHQKGTDVDLRPLRTDHAETGVNYKDRSYSRGLTQDFVNTIRSSSTLPVKSVFFNDSSISGVQYLSAHDDHLHVSFSAPSGTSMEIAEEEEWETRPSKPSAPRLIRTETKPPLASCYVDIRLGSEAHLRPMTGIFFPAGYKAKAEVDLLIYFHGHRIEKRNVKESIVSYWNKAYTPYFTLREVLNESGRSVVLVAPTLGPRSQPGWLGSKGGLDRYVNQVLAAMTAHRPHKGMKLSVGSIVLAAHSGGGAVMRMAATRGGKYSAKIRECWGFDCLYDGVDAAAWSAWAKSHPKSKLYFYWKDTKTWPNARKLDAMKLPNLRVTKSDKGHMHVPIRYWKERLLGYGGGGSPH